MGITIDNDIQALRDKLGNNDNIEKFFKENGKLIESYKLTSEENLFYELIDTFTGEKINI